MIFDLPRLTYGADASGRVCGFHFRPGTPGRAIDADGAIAWLVSSGVPMVEAERAVHDASGASDALFAAETV